VVGRISAGLRWPVSGLAMRPDGRTGTSNEATGGRMRVGFDAPGVLVILPRAWLVPAAVALAPGAV
jgi:thiamine pyrophosphokinase